MTKPTDAFDDATSAWLGDLAADLTASWDMEPQRIDSISRAARAAFERGTPKASWLTRARAVLEPAAAYAVGASYLMWAVQTVFGN